MVRWVESKDRRRERTEGEDGERWEDADRSRSACYSGQIKGHSKDRGRKRSDALGGSAAIP